MVDVWHGLGPSAFWTLKDAFLWGKREQAAFGGEGAHFDFETMSRWAYKIVIPVTSSHGVLLLSKNNTGAFVGPFP